MSERVLARDADRHRFAHALKCLRRSLHESGEVINVGRLHLIFVDRLVSCDNNTVRQRQARIKAQRVSGSGRACDSEFPCDLGEGAPLHKRPPHLVRIVKLKRTEVLEPASIRCLRRVLPPLFQCEQILHGNLSFLRTVEKVPQQIRRQVPPLDVGISRRKSSVRVRREAGRFPPGRWTAGICPRVRERPPFCLHTQR
jgi:hypothetical protein